MKKVLVLLVTFFLSMTFVSAKCTTKTTIKVFYGDGCPFCKALFSFLDNLSDDYKSCYTLEKYEVWNNKDNQEKLNEVQKILNDNSSGVPYLIIGNNIITGYDSEITPERIKNTINYYQNIEYKDKVGIYLGTTTEEKEQGKNDIKKYEDEEINIPILGKKKGK